MIFTVALSISSLVIPPAHGMARRPSMACATTRVIDGDTFDCGAVRIRMQGIDAPEMPGHCRKGRECTPGDPYASAENLRRLLTSRPVACSPNGEDRYGRTIGRCYAGKVDLSCAQLAAGQAVRRYGDIWCW